MRPTASSLKIYGLYGAAVHCSAEAAVPLARQARHSRRLRGRDMGGMRLPGLLSLCRSGRQFAMAGRTPLFLQGVLGDSVKNAAARRVSLQAFRRMSVPFRNMPWRVGTCRRSRETVGIRAGVEAPGYLRGIAVTVRFPDDTEKIVESSTGQTSFQPQGTTR